MFDYDDEPPKFMLLKISICFVFVVCILYLTIDFDIKYQEQYQYEYIDLDNNKGMAKECSYKFEAYNKGGQGSPVCELEDGTVKQVKEYKKILKGDSNE